MKKVDPENSKITLDSGDSWTYDQLIISTGINCDYSQIKGAQAALADPECPVGSAYQKEYAEKMFRIAKSFKGGKFVFTEAQSKQKKFTMQVYTNED